MTMAEEPIWQGRPKLRIVPLRTSEPQSRVGMLFDGKSGILEWPIGPQGDPGPQGKTSRPWRLVGYVTNAADLPSGLGPADAGKAWANTDTKAVHIWQGYRWHDPVPTGLSRTGDAGPPVDLRAEEADTLPAGTDVTASLTGEAPNKVLTVGIPKGDIGDKGPTAPPSLVGATDYVGLPPTRGQAIAWRSAAPPGWVSVRPGEVIGQWSITDAEFDTDALSDGQPRVVATTELGPLPVPYRLSCSGVVVIRHGERLSTAASVSSTAITVDVSYQASGALRVGQGRVVRPNDHEVQGYKVKFRDHVVVVGAYGGKLTADSMEGVIPAGVPATVTVTMQRNANTDWLANRVEAGGGSNLLLTGRPV